MVTSDIVSQYVSFKTSVEPMLLMNRGSDKLFRIACTTHKSHQINLIFCECDYCCLLLGRLCITYRIQPITYRKQHIRQRHPSMLAISTCSFHQPEQAVEDEEVKSSKSVKKCEQGGHIWSSFVSGMVAV
jgi:hypothetical protein